MGLKGEMRVATRRILLIWVFASFFIMFGGCAGKGTVAPQKSDDLAMQASDSPLGPPGVFTIDRQSDGVEKLVVKSEKQQGFEGTLERMALNPLTLYWRESNAYTYSIGDEFVARYQPDTSLTLSDQRDSQPNLVCQFNMQGELDISTLSKERLKAQQKACADLMFTFDSQLAE